MHKRVNLIASKEDQKMKANRGLLKVFPMFKKRESVKESHYLFNATEATSLKEKISY